MDQLAQGTDLHGFGWFEVLIIVATFAWSQHCKWSYSILISVTFTVLIFRIKILQYVIELFCGGCFLALLSSFVIAGDCSASEPSQSSIPPRDIPCPCMVKSLFLWCNISTHGWCFLTRHQFFPSVRIYLRKRFNPKI